MKQDRIKIIETNLDSLDDKLCNKKDSVIEEQRKYLKKELIGGRLNIKCRTYFDHFTKRYSTVKYRS